MTSHCLIEQVRIAGLLLISTALPALAEIDFGHGLASKYPGDSGLEKDPKVLFAEMFEERTLDELKQRWEAVRNPEIISFATDVPAGSGGGHSLLMTHIGGKGDGGHLYRRLSKGHEKVFARFYTRPTCPTAASAKSGSTTLSWPPITSGHSANKGGGWMVDVHEFGCDIGAIFCLPLFRFLPILSRVGAVVTSRWRDRRFFEDFLGLTLPCSCLETMSLDRS